MVSLVGSRLKWIVGLVGLVQVAAYLLGALAVSFETRLVITGAVLLYLLLRADVYFWQRVCGSRAWFFHFNVPAGEPFGILDIPMLSMLSIGTLLLVLYVPVFALP